MPTTMENNTGGSSVDVGRRSVTDIQVKRGKNVIFTFLTNEFTAYYLSHLFCEVLSSYNFTLLYFTLLGRRWSKDHCSHLSNLVLLQ